MEFVRRLAEIRRGECSDATNDFLAATASNIVGGNGIYPTLLHSHNDSVGPLAGGSGVGRQGSGVEWEKKKTAVIRRTARPALTHCARFDLTTMQTRRIRRG